MSCSNLRSKPNDIRELDAIFNKYVEDAENCMKRLHNKVVEITEADQTKSKVGAVVYYKILKVCNGLLSVYFGQALSRTILDIIRVTSQENIVPYLKLSISYKNKLVLQPTSTDLMLIYSIFITKLVECANQFLVLEYYRKKNYPSKYLHINITEGFVNEAIQQVGCNIENLYTPIGVYVKKLEEEFSEIYMDLTLLGMVKYVNHQWLQTQNIPGNLSESSSTIDAPTRFAFGCEQIQHYQEYISKASNMMSSEYFGIGQLILSEYVAAMKESLNMIIESVFNELCAISMEQDLQICQAFEDLKQYALTKPKTSEDLIAQGFNFTHLQKIY